MLLSGIPLNIPKKVTDIFSVYTQSFRQIEALQSHLNITWLYGVTAWQGKLAL